MEQKIISLWTNPKFGLTNPETFRKALKKQGIDISIKELNIAIDTLQWYKAPGRNGISPNTIKALNDENRLQLLKFMWYWMENEESNIKIGK